MSRNRCSFCDSPWNLKEQKLRDEIARLNKENSRLSNDLKLSQTSDITDMRIKRAIEVGIDYGGIDGAHHKMWTIDQMLKWLTGNQYNTVIAESCEGEDGPYTYSWDTGIAP